MLKKLLYLLGFLMTSMLVVMVFIWLQINQTLTSKLNITAPELLTISTGTSMHKFSSQLVEQGYIDSRFWLRNYARLFPEKVQLKKGTYQALPGESLGQLIEKVTSGKEFQLQVTFVEGSTIKDWLVQLRSQRHISLTDATLNTAAVANALGIEETLPEGWFFPDTYAFTVGTSDIDILKRAHQKMRSELERLWQTRQQGLPYQNPYQALIMASIIEKETAVLAEQPRIASVFINRLRKKMRLQTDPTVIYGLGERYQGDITRAHLKEKTAYNTYRINGLPPTPIAMPGIKAIEAALNPEDSEFLYFVSKGDGSHYFSTSLAEHNKAVRKYQLGKS